MFTVSDISNV